MILYFSSKNFFHIGNYLRHLFLKRSGKSITNDNKFFFFLSYPSTYNKTWRSYIRSHPWYIPEGFSDTTSDFPLHNQ